MIVFYISGHGFGHASRDLQVINAIREQQPGVQILLRTSVARWFLESSSRVPIDLHPSEVDVGVVQIDSLRLDEKQTARRANDFYRDFDRRVEDEAAWLRQQGASLVVADVPPLAFAAAHRAGLPSIALSNFTWDWIYEGYPDFERDAPGVLETIRQAYATTTRALRLPFHGGFAPMTHVTTDIPLVARRAARSRNETRTILGLTADRPVVLASFGGYGLQLPYARIARDERLTLIVTDHESVNDEPSVDGFLRLTSAELAAKQVRYEDLVAAADVVVTKPGYGIVSECIANNTALLYTSRGHFVEQDVFVAEMPRVLKCREIPQKEFLAGHWSTPIEKLMAQPDPTERAAINGATVAADEIARTWDPAS